MTRRLAIAVAAAVTACGSGVDLSQSCSMKVSVNGGAQETVQCFAAGASAPGTGNAVSISMTGALADVQVAQFAMTLPSAPTTGTYGATDVSSAAGQVRTATNALYVQSNPGAIGSFSVVLTSVTGASSGTQTAYFLHGSATLTLVGQSGAAGNATITATF